jgi:hypothetical protein
VLIFIRPYHLAVAELLTKGIHALGQALGFGGICFRAFYPFGKIVLVRWRQCIEKSPGFWVFV